MATDFEIRKNANDRWVVAPVVKDMKFKPGNNVTWELRGGKSISAHFQFTDEDLVEDPGRYELTPDWTAVIREGGKTLELKVKKEVFMPLSSRHYAVWVCDPALPFGGTYAIGENPPPKIDLTP